MKLPLPALPPKIASWATASSLAASISYADRGTSAIAASSLLDQLHWSESQLGGVQGAFFAGYAITQVFGGVLGGQKSNDGREGYRIVLPVSLLLTGLTTLLFPLAAIHFGHVGASIDRFILGLFEGLLLPAAMAGVSDTVNECIKSCGVEEDYKATASSMVIAGCYIGSGWAYLSAFALFSEKCQIMLIENGFSGEVWPLIFYLNGVLSFLLVYLYRHEFEFDLLSTKSPLSSQNGDLIRDTTSIATQCIQSKSGRAILAAQIGQGSLLYSISSWGPLYLERVGIESSSIPVTDTAANPSPISQVALTASKAAYSLIPSQITQALVGVSIGATADQLSSAIGTQSTRRVLQILSGVVPAFILLYLASYSGDCSATTNERSIVNSLTEPAFLFGSAQTISALSLGAVSVSHLDVAVPSAAGAVYALGNVMAAIAGSAMVNLFGFLLEQDDKRNDVLISKGQEFAIPFEVVAALSALGSIIYGFTVETDSEIGIETNKTLTT
ncbi:hypothetical protein ACHAWO_007804 [Cyclotella atomus]|uniref:Uncharacterized protein n=1 Tax=Cyclotella atomus TaxID=382360 RepID=A0ABD3QP33_9STRA